MALLTSAADAVVDMLAAVATFFGVRLAQQPEDSGHRFGHGKAEALAAYTQAVLLSAAAVVLAAQSSWRLIFPGPLKELALGAAVAAAGLVISGMLAFMQTYVVRRTGSSAIAADRAHYLTDAALNGAVLVALALTRATGWVFTDSLFALGIAGYMIVSAWRVAVTASGQLLDHELPAADRKRIEAAALGCAGACGMHDLRTRDAGDRLFVEFHLEVEGHASVREGHDIVDAAEQAVANLFTKQTEVIGHLEPAGIVDERIDTRIERHARKHRKTHQR
jgi:cation diffusion facilitator family transporter